MGLDLLIQNKTLLVTTPLLISGVFASYYICSLRKKISSLQDKIEKEKQAKNLEIKKCEEQRLGRTRAERELRRVINSLKDGNNTNNNSTERPPDYPPIGFLESCFRERNGTPRQGLIVTKGKAMLKLKTTVNPSYSLEGLDQYSHCWLIFVFHENTNTLRSIRTDRPSTGVKAKVAPPKLDGVKVGLFSTRTPHRPNPIGLSVAKIDKVVGDTIYLSGIDLIDGTPILDVKPYSVHDSVDDVLNPEWVIKPVVPPLDNVIILDEAKQQLKALVPKMKFYDNYDDIEQCIKEILTEDIRSVRKRRSDKQRDANKDNKDQDDQEEEDQTEKGPEKHRFCIDILNVRFTVVDQVATVFEVAEDQVLTGEQENIYLLSPIYKNNTSEENSGESTPKK
ncbi:hypothetical protein CYY_002475 [Polysphondylium violaceum]|uniref:TsaA-like domain-containing protein n=1 Tax=Polysphondylium violaceum TaxID=133409 RepID=A0A8J4Q036_9MYCE|nr:hypothetical protein CYY_002475 [Polysphondylium violaceum]